MLAARSLYILPMMDAKVPGKLRMKSAQSIVVLNAPPGYLEDLRAALPGARIATRLSGAGGRPGRVELIQVFHTHRSALQSQLPGLKAALAEQGILWVCYPKGSAKAGTDLNRDILFQWLKGEGLQAVAQVAVDDYWSAMRFKST